jgi:hypothetical protein
MVSAATTGLTPRIARLQPNGGRPLSGVQAPSPTVPGPWSTGITNNATLNGDGWPTPTIVGRTIGIAIISHGVLSAVRLSWWRRLFSG